MHSQILRRFFLADDLPTPGKAVYLFFEFIALGFALEAIADLVHYHGPWYRWSGSLLAAALFLTLGVKGPVIRSAVWALWSPLHLISKAIIIALASIAAIISAVWLILRISAGEAHPSQDNHYAVLSDSDLYHEARVVSDAILELMRRDISLKQQYNDSAASAKTIEDQKETTARGARVSVEIAREYDSKLKLEAIGVRKEMLGRLPIELRLSRENARYEQFFESPTSDQSIGEVAADLQRIEQQFKSAKHLNVQ